MDAQLKNKPRHEFTAYVLINSWGFSFHWNAYDLMRDATGLYKLAIFDGKLSQPRLWWSFLWNEFDGHASLTYEQGRKHKQVVGWTLRGPLAKFTQMQKI